MKSSVVSVFICFFVTVPAWPCSFVSTTVVVVVEAPSLATLVEDFFVANIG